MKNRKIKTAAKTSAALLLALAAALVSFAADTAPHGWYVDRSGASPACPREMKFIEEHDCFYIDPAAAENKDRVIYLTFDAGYENGNIAKILDVLSEKEAKGTFFILENMVRRESELVLRMKNEGHTDANHSATHPDMTRLSEEEFREELDRMDDRYRELTGEPIARFYRPPEGKLSPESVGFAERMGYRTVMWSFAYADWDNERQPDPEKAVEKILANTHNGMIILLHPTSSTNAAILGRLIDAWREEGYRFAAVEELV